MDPRAVLRAFADLALPEDVSEKKWARNDVDVIEDPQLITPVGHVAQRLFEGEKVGDWWLQGVRRPPQTGRFQHNVALDPEREGLVQPMPSNRDGTTTPAGSSSNCLRCSPS